MYALKPNSSLVNGSLVQSANRNLDPLNSTTAAQRPSWQISNPDRDYFESSSQFDSAFTASFKGLTMASGSVVTNRLPVSLAKHDDEALAASSATDWMKAIELQPKLDVLIALNLAVLLCLGTEFLKDSLCLTLLPRVGVYGVYLLFGGIDKMFSKPKLSEDNVRIHVPMVTELTYTLGIGRTTGKFVSLPSAGTEIATVAPEPLAALVFGDFRMGLQPLKEATDKIFLLPETALPLEARGTKGTGFVIEASAYYLFSSWFSITIERVPWFEPVARYVDSYLADVVSADDDKTARAALTGCIDAYEGYDSGERSGLKCHFEYEIVKCLYQNIMLDASEALVARLGRYLMEALDWDHSYNAFEIPLRLIAENHHDNDLRDLAKSYLELLPTLHLVQ